LATEWTYFATCPKGLEAVLARELSAILARTACARETSDGTGSAVALHASHCEGGAAAPPESSGGGRGIAPQALRVTVAGVEFSGPLEAGYAACLYSRVASRVLVQLATFPAPDPEALYAGMRSIPWHTHFGLDKTFAVSLTSTRSAVTHTAFGALKCKDAIADGFREELGARPNVDKELPDVLVNVHLGDNVATVGIDLSGESLHRRTGRAHAGPAPMKENLAAGILLLAGWPEVAASGGGFLDPMCGSGTLVLEAARIAACIAPGLGRERFGFMGWSAHRPDVWERLVSEARAAQRPSTILREAQHGGQRAPAGSTTEDERTGGETVGAVNAGAGVETVGAEDGCTGVAIVGCDNDPAAVRKAEAAARESGLSRYVRFERRELSLAEPPGDRPGLVVVNPPYGERLGDARDLELLYQRIGSTLKDRFPRWTAWIFTGNRDLAKKLSLRVTRRIPLYNGPIECRLLCVPILAPKVAMDDAVCKDHPEWAGARVEGSGGDRRFSRSAPGCPGSEAAPAHDQDASDASMGSEDATPIANRLRKNLRNLGRWARREGVTCYRIYDADLPEYALSADIYERWVHVTENERPDTVNPMRAEARLHEAMDALTEVLGIPAENVFVKQRMRGLGRYVKGPEKGDFHVVTEAGLKFLVNFTRYHDTGLFLDHRPMRALIRSFSAGRRFLNLFGYTGAATVSATAGGAIATATVDLSGAYLEWAGRNMEANCFRGPQHKLVEADVLEWLEHAHGRYGLIFLDPPTFSNSKSMRGTLDVQRDHVQLIRSALRLLEPDGILLFSNNFRRFKMDRESLSDLEVADISAQTIPPDFARHPRIHNAWRICRKKA